MLALAESINAEQDETYEKEIDKLDKKTRIAAAREMVRQFEDRPAADRLTHGIRGLLPEAQTQTRPFQSPHLQPQAEEVSLNQNGQIK